MKRSYLVLVFAFVLVGCASPKGEPSTTPLPTNWHTPKIVPLSTLTHTPTNTPEPTQTLTPIPSLTPTSTDVPPSFVLDFPTDILEWKTGLNNQPRSGFNYTYNQDGLELSYAVQPGKPYLGHWVNPEKVIKIEGDFDIEVTFDQRMRFSGLWFCSGSFGFDNQFAILTDQGASVPTWETAWDKEGAALGVLIPSKGDWTWIGEKDMEPYLKSRNEDIVVYLSFNGDQMSVAINGEPFASEANPMFSGTKYFMGYVVGNGDHFVIKSTRLWVDYNGSMEFVSANPEDSE